MSEEVPVSSELKSIIRTEQPQAAAPSEEPMNKLLAALSLALTIVVIALSISVSRLSNISSSGSSAVIVSDIVPTAEKGWVGENPCTGAKKQADLPNIACMVAQIDGDEMVNDAFALGTAEQSGVNVTKGYNGDYDTDAEPILEDYFEVGMCPVNVHWHLGTEHYSLGEYDENGKGPSDDHRRQLAGKVRMGYQCHHYDEKNPAFTTEYDWQHCVNTHVGETYEIHWPHSGTGACGTVNQFQTPFYDGVFCTGVDPSKVGVQGQVFTIVNDERYYYPDLMRGMIKDGEFGADIATYTGSTTGTSRDNEICSQYTGITWKVDRKCHMISASSFDKMCADMKSQRDDMSEDLYPHGSRELVADHLAADNHSTRKQLRA